MSTITVVVPTYNEEKNIPHIYERVKKVFEDQIKQHDFQILFADNASKDDSQKLIRELCEKDDRLHAIFNNTNFGFSKSSFYGLSQAEGDCAVLMYADMQDPPEVIPQMVKKWEELPSSVFEDIPDNQTVYALPVDSEKTYGNSIFPGNYIDLYFRASVDENNQNVPKKLFTRP